jgi:hypothetical protein
MLGGGTRSRTLFPLSGTFRNFGTDVVVISVQVARVNADGTRMQAIFSLVVSSAERKVDMNHELVIDYISLSLFYFCSVCVYVFYTDVAESLAL